MASRAATLGTVEAVEVAAPRAPARKGGGIQLKWVIAIGLLGCCIFDAMERGPKAVVHNPFTFEASGR